MVDSHGTWLDQQNLTHLSSKTLTNYLKLNNVIYVWKAVNYNIDLASDHLNFLDTFR